jgi:hypothetical protein
MEQALLVWDGDESRWELWHNGRCSVVQNFIMNHPAPRYESRALQIVAEDGWSVVCTNRHGDYVLSRGDVG